MQTYSLPFARAVFATMAVGFSPCLGQGAITSQNVTYRINSLPAGVHDIGGEVDFTADPGSMTDTATHQWWYYRVAGDSAESAFNTGGGQLANQLYLPNVAVLNWPEVDGRGFSAELRIEAIPVGLRSGFAISRLALSNRTAQPITLHLFHYADADVCGLGSDDAAGDLTGSRHTVIDSGGSCGTQRVEVLGVDSDRFQVAAFPQLRDAMLNARVDNLDGTGLPFQAGNYTGALAWDSVTLAPFASREFVAVLSHNHTVCDERAAVRSYGQGRPGSSGTPRALSLLRPILGSSPYLLIRGAPPRGSGIVLLGRRRANVQFMDLTVLVDADGAVPIAFDAGGVGTVRRVVPNDPALCGETVNFQCFFADPGASPPLQVAHTAGIEWILGGY